jgi:DNA repair photolyase
MLKVTLIDRKSNALTPSNLRCLSHLPTINMAAGCVHGCAYCYIRGYSQYPGEDAAVVYRNTAEQVERELQNKIKRKRPLPGAVYFCPSSDAFMPIDEVLDQSYRTMKLLLDQGVGVQFVTKGAISERFFDLFAAQPQLVAGQVGLTTLDDRLNAAIEPKAAPAARRLSDLDKLIDIGVTTSLRADPLIHGLTDNDADLNALFGETAKCGVRDVSASYLFLRPAIVGSLRRSIHDEALLQRILAPFENVGRSSFNTRSAASGGTSLPVELRRKELDRVRHIAERHSLALRICGCKNGDITNNKCHLTNLTTSARANKCRPEQLSLW